MGKVFYQKIYGSDNFEIMCQTAWRGGPARIAVCTREDDAEAICTAMEYAIKNGVVK
jgi:hypothetical protein